MPSINFSERNSWGKIFRNFGWLNWKYLNYDSMSIRWIPHILWLGLADDFCRYLPKNQISAECMYIENIQG
jgi:hypothetical protein